MRTHDLACGGAQTLARLCLRLALIALAILAGILLAPAFAQEAPSGFSIDVAPTRAVGAVQAMIADEVCAQIGCKWGSTALRIAKIESGFRCNARNGRAVGIFQNANPAMFGVTRAAALTCSGGIRAGVAHMKLCAAKGAQTTAQHMRCYNSGSPWGRVERAYRIALSEG